jgi:type IV pilus assembly protein PilQ
MRVVVNLVESQPFETKIAGNKILLTLNNHSAAAAPVAVNNAPKAATLPSVPAAATLTNVAPAAPITGLAIAAVHVDSLSSNKLQIQLEMNGAAIKPEVFRTDNPPRITLDFAAVKNGMNKKMLAVNQGAVNSIYFIDSGDRMRVVINLLESMPLETKLVDNKVVLTLSAGNPVTPIMAKATAPIANARPVPVSASSTSAKNYALAGKLMPEQAISGFDFKRGDNGEGRLLVSLASPNTIVNSKEEGGKIILSFVNTRLPEHLSKRLDFSEFATPVKYIEAQASNKETTVAITTQNKLYDYSLFQSNGLLTVEFRPLSDVEKENLDKSRVKYTGERLSLNFQDIEIRSVIAILAEFTGQNVVAGDDVVGTITLKLDDVPWDEALDFVMMTKGLGKFETGNVTLISPLDKIKDYKKKQQETEAVVGQLEPLVTEYVKVSYAKASDLKSLLMGRDTGAFGSCGNQQIKNKTTVSNSTSSASGASTPSSMTPNAGSNNATGSSNSTGSAGGNSSNQEQEIPGQLSLLSRRGSLFVDSRTNTLIIHDTAKQLVEIKKLLHKLDVPVRQVMIEARVVNASNTFTKALGVRFGGSKVASVANSSMFGVGGSGTYGSLGTSATTTKITDGSTTKDGTTTTDGSTKVETSATSGSVNQGRDMLVDLGLTAAQLGSGGALAMTLARGADYVLNLELSAAQTQGIVEVLANPRVMTADRCIATIKQGVQIPYSTASTTGNSVVTTTIFQDANLQLDVLPQITPNGNVIMSLRISNDTLGLLTVNGQYPINTEELQTNVQVLDGETLVLGGVFGQTQNNSVDKVPFFADLPGIGFLFKRTNKLDEKKELLIFITPKIVKDSFAFEAE